MGLVEMKELIKILVKDAFIATLVIYAILHIFARITYKSHKNVKKVYKKASKNVNVVFDHGINTKDWTIFDYKEDRDNMNKILKGVM